MTYAKRVDENHGLIGETFRKCGFLALDLSKLGDGAPDWLVKKGMCWLLIEVKTAKGKRRPKQETFAATWPVFIVRTVDDVLALNARVV